MNPARSINVRRHEEARSSRNEDHDAHSILRSRTEDEKQRRRREWLRQQEREKQHERLKQQKILEYEKRRAQALGLPEPKSFEFMRTAPKGFGTLFEKLDGSASGTVPLFKGPDGIHISSKELNRIKVDIRRNIPVNGPTPEIGRSITNAEDVVLKRRKGEESKPIFDREDIENIADNEINQRKEQRTVVARNGEQSVTSSKPQTSKERSSSLSPIYSSTYRSCHQSRSFVKERSYHDRYRDRSSKRFRERRDGERDKDSDRDRDRSRERRDVAPHYIEPPIHVPIYYNLPPRPIVVRSMPVPFRPQVPPIGRGQHSALMAPIRPFLPRFIPPDMYRLGPPPPNPRYGPF